jgi:hypothetical protein
METIAQKLIRVMELLLIMHRFVVVTVRVKEEHVIAQMAQTTQIVLRLATVKVSHQLLAGFVRERTKELV